MPIRVATVRAADVPASQTNMPVFFDIGRIGATALTLAEANSLRVYTDTDLVTQMAREIVSATEGHAKYPSLTSTSKIAMDFDGIRADYAVTDTFGRNNVWTGHTAVYHLNESSGNASDSTVNAYTLTNTNTVGYATSKINNGADFTSTNPDKRLTYTTDTMGIGATGAITFGGWVRATEEVTSADFGVRSLFFKLISGASGSEISVIYEFNGGTRRLRFQRAGSANSLQYHTVTLGIVDFNHIQITFDGSTVKGYLNGVEVTSVANSGTQNIGSQGTFIGVFNTANIGYWRGLIDETRVSQSARSANWITTEYNNQNAESTFWGTWSTFGGGGFTPTPLMHMRMMAGGMV